MKNKLQKLEQKIRELCPELMELSFGCRLKFVESPDTYLIGEYILMANSEPWIRDGKTYLDCVVISHSIRDERGWSIQLRQKQLEDCEIIGHPITLEACNVAITRYSKLEKLEDKTIDSIVKECTLSMEFNNQWKDFEPWEKQTEVYELLFEIFNIK